jgi:hypothetical protein
MIVRWAASQIACASAASFFWRLTKGSHEEDRIKLELLQFMQFSIPFTGSQVRARPSSTLLHRALKLTFGRRSQRLHHHPAFCGQGSGGRDHS